MTSRSARTTKGGDREDVGNGGKNANVGRDATFGQVRGEYLYNN